MPLGNLVPDRRDAINEIVVLLSVGPTLSTSGLQFIQDTELRTELRSDLGAIERALSNGEWKAATILAGSSVEVLLLWALQQKPRSEIPKLSSKALDD